MKAKPLDLKGAENICTDPRNPKFFEGTTVERQLSALKHVSPAKYDALAALVVDALRAEFLKIGPDPRKAREGVF